MTAQTMALKCCHSLLLRPVYYHSLTSGACAVSESVWNTCTAASVDYPARAEVYEEVAYVLAEVQAQYESQSDSETANGD